MAVRPLRGSEQRKESSMIDRPRRRLGPADPPLLHLLKELSGGAAFDDENSPQSKAYNWLDNEDLMGGGDGDGTTWVHSFWTYEASVHDDKQVLERYAAAVLYYASGESISGWPKPGEDVCDWSGIDCNFCICNDGFCDCLVGVVAVDAGNALFTIPMEVSAWNFLSKLEIDNIQLDGPIPTEVWYMNSLGVFEWYGIDMTQYSRSRLGGVNMSPIFLLSGAEALSGQESPQHKALDWLVQTDQYNLADLTQEKLLERYAAAVLYYATGGKSAVKGKWMNKLGFLGPEEPSDPPKSICDWHTNTPAMMGIFCYGSGDNKDLVRSVALFDNNLIGSIPMEVKAWKKATNLALRGNPALEGPIPSEIGSMISLTSLGLQNNTLTGEIPSEIGKLVNLDFLNFENNALGGEVPTEILNLSSLKGLRLGGNKDLTITEELKSVILAWSELKVFSIGDDVWNF